MKRVAIICAVPATANAFLKGHIKRLRADFEVDIITNFANPNDLTFEVDNKINIPIVRQINLSKDILCVLLLYRIIRRGNYDVVHTVTPKAGLIGMLAARMACVENRFHTFTGQVWATKVGFGRKMLKTIDRFLFNLTSFVLVDSATQREFLLKEQVITEERSKVLCHGSISGVDLNKFKIDAPVRKRYRKMLGIPDNAFVFIFLGRINREKGIIELLDAFQSLSARYPDVKLLIVGPDEEGIFSDSKQIINRESSIFRIEFTSESEKYLNVADAFCLPSHREGFGSVLIEAAACGLPSIASDIYGIQDAVLDGETGLLHLPKSPSDILQKMEIILLEEKFRQKLALAATNRAKKYFSAELLEEALFNFYRERLEVEDCGGD